jgi:hypothetical protein
VVSPAVGRVTVPTGGAGVGVAGTGVFCGLCGVLVGVSVSRGSGVSVGGSGVSVGGSGVSVGGSAVGVSVMPNSGIALLELELYPINAKTNKIASIREPMRVILFMFLPLSRA